LAVGTRVSGNLGFRSVNVEASGFATHQPVS